MSVKHDSNLDSDGQVLRRTWGESIERHRRARDWDRQDLADRAKVSVATVIAAEGGRGGLNVYSRLLATLELDVTLIPRGWTAPAAPFTTTGWTTASEPLISTVSSLRSGGTVSPVEPVYGDPGGVSEPPTASGRTFTWNPDDGEWPLVAEDEA